MNSEEFEVNGRILIRSTYLDISVLIDKETGYYYAQKICDDNDKRLENLLQNNDYELMKQAVSATTGIPVVELAITFDGMPNGYRSKWVHKLLVNYIAQWANKEYAVKIAMLLDLIDERLKLENRTLQQEINSERRLVEQLQTDNGNLNRQVNELNLRIQNVEEQNNQLLEDNRVTHTKLNQIGEQITGLTDLVGDDLNELNLTTSTARYIYMVISRPALVTEMRNNNVIDTTHSCFDTLCCLKKDRADRLTKHGYNRDTDRIELEYECSCSLDLSKWITRHFNRITCSNLNTTRYKRKIIYLTNSHDEVLADIADYIARTTHVKETIINRLEHLQTIVETQNEQIQELREEINQLQVSLNEHRPGATKIQSNRLFRDLEIRDGSVYFRPSARADPIELTLEMIMDGNTKFRDANGHIVHLH